MGVTVGEADVGDVATVAVVLVAWCLERAERNSPLFKHHHKKEGFQERKLEKSVGSACYKDENIPNTNLFHRFLFYFYIILK